MEWNFLAPSLKNSPFSKKNCFISGGDFLKIKSFLLTINFWFSQFFFLKIKTPVFFSGQPLRVSIFHHCFFGVFIVDCIFSGHHFSSPWLFLLLDFFVRYFFFVLLYHECYRLEKTFFTLRCFLPYTPSPHLPRYHKCYRFERDFCTPRSFLLYTPLRHLAQSDVAPTCLQGFPESRQFFLEIAGPPNSNSAWNTTMIHPFVWITQCSAKGITW